jgi:uncharacterized protein (TIGR02284 family)
MKKLINILITRNLEAHKTYALAAGEVENTNFKTFLEEYAEKRKNFAIELKQIPAAKAKETNGKSSTISGIESGYTRLRIALPGSQDKAILQKCARIEARTLAAYENILAEIDGDNDITQLLMSQRDKVLVTSRSLRDIAPLLKDKKVNSTSR